MTATPRVRALNLNSKMKFKSEEKGCEREGREGNRSDSLRHNPLIDLARKGDLEGVRDALAVGFHVEGLHNPSYNPNNGSVTTRLPDIKIPDSIFEPIPPRRLARGISGAQTHRIHARGISGAQTHRIHAPVANTSYRPMPFSR